MATTKFKVGDIVKIVGFDCGNGNTDISKKYLKIIYGTICKVVHVYPFEIPFLYRIEFVKHHDATYKDEIAIWSWSDAELELANNQQLLLF